MKKTASVKKAFRAQPRRAGAFFAAVRFLEQHDLLTGILAAAFLPLFYLLLLTALNGFSHALRQISTLLGWMLLLSVGLGLQVQLYFRLRRLHREADSKAVAASGGASAFSMAACCAHHASDVLPAFGLAAAASFLSYYQDGFLLLGVLSNLGGLIYMLSCYRDARLKTEGPLDSLLAADLKSFLPLYVTVAAALVAADFAFLWFRTSS